MKIPLIATPNCFLARGNRWRMQRTPASTRPDGIGAASSARHAAAEAVVTQPWTPATAARLGKVPAPYAETLSKTMAASGAFRAPTWQKAPARQAETCSDVDRHLLQQRGYPSLHTLVARNFSHRFRG